MSAIPSGGAEVAAEVAAATPMRAPQQRPSRFGGESVTGWLFSAPAIILIACFIILPFLLAFYFSFTNERLLSPPGRETQWIGFDNYARVFNNPRFWTSLGNNITFSLIVVPLQTFFALFLALLVNQKLRGVVVFRTIFFIPITVVMAASAVIWVVLLNPQGLINAFFEILIYNYQLNFYREETTDGGFKIRLTEHMTFLNKAALKRILREVPKGCTLTIDMTGTRILDHDVREVIQDFATHAAADDIKLRIEGESGPKVALMGLSSPPH